jgi:hypothetical protein
VNSNDKQLIFHVYNELKVMNTFIEHKFTNTCGVKEIVEV